MSVIIIAWLKLDKITSNKNIKIIKILDKRLETNLGEDSGWYFKCEYKLESEETYELLKEVLL